LGEGIKMAAEKDLGFRAVGDIEIGGKPGEPEREVFARASLSPLMKAAGTIHEYAVSITDYEICDLMVVLDKQVSETLSGSDLKVAQRILAGQAFTLDAIFNKLAIEAANNIDTDHANVELYLKFALRAQSQSRAAFLALNDIMNPSLANFVNQANISAGHQQINNHVEKESPPSELMEQRHERMDTRTPREAGTTYSTVEAVGAVDRSKKP
jgi:hypothetical protein